MELRTELPGGLPCDDRLCRDFQFAPLTTGLEQRLSESRNEVGSLPQQVTLVLTEALESVAGGPADAQRVRALSAGDRLFLLLRWIERLDPAPRWITTHCAECDQPIQFPVAIGDLPVQSAGPGYPRQCLRLSLGKVELRVPNGEDEEYIADLDEREIDPLTALLSRLLRLDGRPVAANELDATDLRTIDQALDAMAPQVGLEAETRCPYCDQRQRLAIDPYVWMVPSAHDVDQEIHTLALHYHWPETEILALPRARRRRYLRLIERSLGRYRAEDLVPGMAGGGR